MVDSSDMVNLIFLNKIGEAVLSQTFRDAAYFLMHSNNLSTKNRELSFDRRYHQRDFKEAYAFVAGTGVNVIVESYYLELDPVKLKNSFLYFVRRSV